MRSTCPPHYHQIKLPSGRVIRTKDDCHKANTRRLQNSIALELGHYQDGEDEELGILGLIGALAPTVLSAVGGLLGGGKKKGKAPAAAPAAAPIYAPPVSEGASAGEISNIVRGLLSEVPPPVRDQVRSALQEYKLSNVDNKATISEIVGKVAREFQPKLLAAAELLKEKQLQTAATNEHNVIVKDDHRWTGNTDNQEKIYKRIQLMEKRVASALKTRRSHNAKVSAAFGIPNDQVM